MLALYENVAKDYQPTQSFTSHQMLLRNSSCAIPRCWVHILTGWLFFQTLSWNSVVYLGSFPCLGLQCCILTAYISYRVSFTIIGRSISQTLPKMTSGLLMSVMIAILIIQLQVIITNDVHCLKKGSGLAQEPIKPCFSGYKLSPLIFSKPITNGIFFFGNSAIKLLQCRWMKVFWGFFFFFPLPFCNTLLWKILGTEDFALNKAKK